MQPKLLLVDYENVQQVNLSQLDESYSIVVFVGAYQKSVPIDLVITAQRFGERIEWQRVEGIGSNALDFFIAFHLGRVLEKTPARTCIVLSKDKGFDPLLRHLASLGMKCSRVNSLLELEPDTAQPDDPNYRKVVEMLDKNRKTRPRKRKTLAQYIAATIFSNKLPQPEIDHLIDLLFANRMISENGEALSYEF